MVKEFTFTYEEKKKMAAQTAEILTEEIGLKGDAIQAVHLIPDIEEGKLSMADVDPDGDVTIVDQHADGRIEADVAHLLALQRQQALDGIGIHR